MKEPTIGCKTSDHYDKVFHFILFYVLIVMNRLLATFS